MNQTYIEEVSIVAFLQKRAMIVPWNRPWYLPFLCFLMCYSNSVHLVSVKVRLHRASKHLEVIPQFGGPTLLV